MLVKIKYHDEEIPKLKKYTQGDLIDWAKALSIIS